MAWYAELRRRKWYCINGINMVNIYKHKLYDDWYNSLTNEQKQQLQEYYYQDDYSLSEIAEILNVSRNAVYDNLKKAVHSLEKYEEKLQLMKKHQERLDLIQRIEDDIASEHKDVEEYLEMLRKI